MPREQLEEAIALLGWSRTRLAHAVYVATHDDDDPVAIARLEQRIKKEFQRSTTKPERFARYLCIVRADPEYARISQVVPRYVPNSALSPEVFAGLAKISDQISNQLVEQEWAREES